jgi:pre-mRNA-splicing helicase BRR2
MGADEDAQGPVDANSNANGDEEGEILIGNAPDRKRAKKEEDQVAPHEIDGFWLQRMISAAYVDPRQASELTSKTMDLLSSDTDLRDLENSLAEVFGYENFEMVALLIKNRDAIVWCTKLARSNEEERHDVEVAMREKGLGWILRALIGDRSGASQVTSLRATKQIEADGPIQSSTQANNRSQRIIDIESMIFAQGGHTMSNKKVKLPTGSFKRSGKGFEEIHVPIPDKRVATPDETPVQIASLPEWTFPVWGKTTQLNPVQSKVFPVAFGTDEPMLLCAPTGAGKVSTSALLTA